jgi:hypothetical protein
MIPLDQYNSDDDLEFDYEETEFGWNPFFQPIPRIPNDKEIENNNNDE